MPVVASDAHRAHDPPYELNSGRVIRPAWEQVARGDVLRAALEAAGFKLRPGNHPILPVMIGDAALASRMADMLLERGIYVIGFSYPVVPQGQARIRIQLSAAHTQEQLDQAAKAFVDVAKELKVI
jgi:glycine C-acetyltransferase